MATPALDEIAPWVGDDARFPREGDMGFDCFDFTSKQVETICREKMVETAADIVRALTALDMKSDKDLLLAVQAAANVALD